jgi:Zinc knuckle
MNIEARIARVKELIAKREAFDAELNELLGNGVVREKRSSKCSLCGEPGHRSTTCPSKQIAPEIA